jgi:ABC-type uncharacterized transport system substrate-binding protein
MTKSATLALIAFCLLASPPPATAHPHIFVDYKVTLNGGADGITGLSFDWAFDEMYSLMLLGEQGLDSKPRLTTQEAAKLGREGFPKFPQNYRKMFYSLKSDGQDLATGDATDLTATKEGDRVVLHFTVPFKKPVKNIVFGIQDPTFYIGIDPAKDNFLTHPALPDLACDTKEKVTVTSDIWSAMHPTIVKCTLK